VQLVVMEGQKGGESTDGIDHIIGDIGEK